MAYNKQKYEKKKEKEITIKRTNIDLGQEDGFKN